MADTSPRRPYPGQQWRHGWEPVTAAAKASKGKQGNPVAIKAKLAEARQAALSKSTPPGGVAWAKGKTAPGSSKSSSAPSKPAAKAPAKPSAQMKARTPAAKTAPKPASKPASTPTAQALDDAKAAIKAGQNAKAVNILTRAMRGASKDEKKAIGKVRDELAAKVMGKKAAPKGEAKMAKPQKEAPTPEADDDDYSGLPAGVHGVDSGGNMLRSGDTVRVDSGPHDGKSGTVVGRNADGTLKVNVGGKTVNVPGGDVAKQRPAAKTEGPKPKVEAPKPAAKQDAPPKPAQNDSGTESGPGSKGPYGIDLSAPRDTQVKQTEAAIRQAFEDLDDERNAAGWLPMLAVRNALPGVSRDVQDAALMKLLVQPDVRIAENSTRFWSSDEDKAAALDVLGSPNDQIMILNPDGSVKRPDKKPAQNRSGGKVSDAEAQDRIAGAVSAITSKGTWGTMAELRDKLEGMDRKQQDRLIADMMLDGKLDLVPASNSGSLTQAERDAAIDIGATPNHRIRLGDKKHTRQTPSESGKAKPETPDKKPAAQGGKKVSDAQVESSVSEALNSIPTKSRSGWRTMGQLRDALDGIPRSQQDAVIRQMMLDGKVDIEPVAIYNDLPQKERDAEIIIGSTPSHQIRLAR